MLQAAADGGDGQAVITEFKTMVREAHKAGIEVILDVVFNHTAEGNENGPTLSFRLVISPTLTPSLASLLFNVVF